MDRPTEIFTWPPVSSTSVFSGSSGISSPKLLGNLDISKRYSYKQACGLQSDIADYMVAWDAFTVPFYPKVKRGDELNNYEFIIAVNESLYKARLFHDFCIKVIDENIGSSNGFLNDRELSWLATFKKPEETQVSAADLVASKLSLSILTEIRSKMKFFETIVDSEEIYKHDTKLFRFIDINEYIGLKGVSKLLKQFRVSIWSLHVKTLMNVKKKEPWFGVSSSGCSSPTFDHLRNYSCSSSSNQQPSSSDEEDEEETPSPPALPVNTKCPRPDKNGVINEGIYINVNPEWLSRRIKYRYINKGKKFNQK